MTKLDQVKADLIDIIGDRKVVNVKDVKNVSRSSVMIDIDKSDRNNFVYTLKMP